MARDRSALRFSRADRSSDSQDTSLRPRSRPRNREAHPLDLRRHPAGGARLAYPALQRLEREGWIAAKWEQDTRGREMKFYRLTPNGRKQLTLEESRWRQMVGAMSRIVRPG